MKKVSCKPSSTEIESATHHCTCDHLVYEDESQKVFASSVVSLEYMLGEEVVQALSESHIREYPHE